MIRAIAASHYLHPVREDEALPSLDTALQPLCREHFRRIDRFIQLALLGSARCVAGHRLAVDCGLYLGSGLGPMSNNISTQEQLIRDHLTPKPFNFINTLGNSAGYYVAKNLGLSGPNLFISRRGASFQAALETALVDLECGTSRQALVGVVEEVTLPLAAHRRRQGLSVDTVVAEGSHWLLLETDAVTGHRLERRQALRHESEMLDVPAFHDSIAAAGVTENVSKGGEAVLADGWTLFHFRP
ncbi:MAG TPA: beta-ketoacyl synthase N-terminal-like domain-containing protein [Gammaproteobacteria bacterium]|nr:beta-ketoacyl synthase N-terminal-like domain-containing protein [Gammaproteobacteria bacterium]